MTRYAVTLRTQVDRAKAAEALRRAPDGYHVEFRAPTRSLEQNSRLWELLGRVAERMTLQGRQFDAESWKVIFLQAMGQEVHFLPTLDGGYFPSGFRSSKLTVREMADMQTFIEAWCPEQGVDIWLT